MTSKWSEFLKSLGSTNPECAGRLRQGLPKGFINGILEISFSPLFSRQLEFLNEESQRQSIEASLEDFYEAPLRITLIKEKPAAIEQQPESPHPEDPQLNEQHQNDPAAQIVQKVFNVTIRNVFQDAPPVQYHLGKSCNFKEN